MSKKRGKIFKKWKPDNWLDPIPVELTVFIRFCQFWMVHDSSVFSINQIGLLSNSQLGWSNRSDFLQDLLEKIVYLAFDLFAFSGLSSLPFICALRIPNIIALNELSPKPSNRADKKEIIWRWNMMDIILFCVIFLIKIF